MGYHVPIAFGFAIFAYVTLVGVPAAADGRLGARFPLWHFQPPRLGVETSATPTCTSIYNPAHMIARGVVLLRHDLRAGAAWRPDSCRRPNPERGAPRRKPRIMKTPSSGDFIGYSNRHAGHPPVSALLLALNAGFWSAVCIIISGPVWTSGWPEWWNWWLTLPIWPDQGLVYDSTGMATYGTKRPRRRGRKLNHGLLRNIRTSSPRCRCRASPRWAWARPARTSWAASGQEGRVFDPDRLLGNAQLGPIYLGWAGLISLATGTLWFNIVGFNMLAQVDWSIPEFIRQLFWLALEPPGPGAWPVHAPLMTAGWYHHLELLPARFG